MFTLPPVSPLTSMVEPALTQSVPVIVMVPPFASLPFARMEPSATVTSAPSTVISPPCSPGSSPDALRVPATRTVPWSPPSRKMRPFFSVTVLASITPLMLITFFIMPLAFFADRMTWPPSAWMEPEFEIRSLIRLPSLSRTCPSTGSLTVNLIRLSPTKSTVAASPETRPTVPRFAITTPLFSTDGAISAAKSDARILPSFRIDASGLV